MWERKAAEWVAHVDGISWVRATVPLLIRCHEIDFLQNAVNLWLARKNTNRAECTVQWLHVCRVLEFSNTTIEPCLFFLVVGVRDVHVIGVVKSHTCDL